MVIWQPRCALALTVATSFGYSICIEFRESPPMSAVDTAPSPTGGLLASILSEDSFRPAEPKSIEETGLTAALVENLLLKYVMLIGSAAGRQLADNVCLPFGLVEPMFQSLRQRQLLINSASRSEEHTSELQSHSDLVCR